MNKLTFATIAATGFAPAALEPAARSSRLTTRVDRAPWPSLQGTRRSLPTGPDHRWSESLHALRRRPRRALRRLDTLMAQGRLPGQAVKRPARACRPTHTSDGTSLFLPCTNFRSAYDVPAHLVDIEAIPYLGCGARDVAVTRGQLRCGAGQPAHCAHCGSVAGPQARDVRALSGLRAHFGRCDVPRLTPW
jgi:hypothetical protein